jgi:isoaspartyl peptidase/L-asparaginase-like protein (Ntn-hydrolase superfamily)
MGGAVKAVGKAVGIQKSPVQVAADVLQKEKPVQKAGQDEMELAARRRGARRRGAMLMSDAKLNPANETLGGGNNLG